MQHALLRVQRAIATHLPPQLWLEKIDVGAAPGSGARRRPVVVVEGAGKALNGVEVNRVMLEFKEKLSSDPGMAGLPEPQMQTITTRDKAEGFKLTIDLEGR